MTHQQMYVSLTKSSQELRRYIQATFGVFPMIQLKDSSDSSTNQTFLNALSLHPSVYQFNVNDMRGFITIPTELTHWIVEELMGMPVQSKQSMMHEACTDSMVMDVFKENPIINDPQSIDISTIWVHPTFDRFLHMTMAIIKSNDSVFEISFFLPKGVQND